MKCSKCGEEKICIYERDDHEYVVRCSECEHMEELTSYVGMNINDFFKIEEI